MLVNWAYCQTNKILFPAQVTSYFLFSLKWISSSFISYFISSSLVAAVPCWILNGAQLILIDAHFWILETKCFSMFWHTNKVKSFSSLCHFAHISFGQFNLFGWIDSLLGVKLPNLSESSTDFLAPHWHWVLLMLNLGGLLTNVKEAH